MTLEADRDALAELLQALDEVAAGFDEAFAVLGGVPDDAEALQRFQASERLAARSLLKSVEQMQDLLGRTIRATLVIEQVDLAGLSPRAWADRAESIGALPSSDEWSALVRLRNELVHEYPLSPAQRLLRLSDAWTSVAALRGVHRQLRAYILTNKVLGDGD